MNWKLIVIIGIVLAILTILPIVRLFWQIEGFQNVDDSRPFILTSGACGPIMDQIRSTEESIQQFREKGETRSLSIAISMLNGLNKAAVELKCKSSDTAPKITVDPSLNNLTPEQRVELEKQTNFILSTSPKEK